MQNPVKLRVPVDKWLAWMILMIQKSIRLTVKAGQVDEFLARQKIWNQRMRQARGFVSISVGQHVSRPNFIQIDVRFQNADDLQHFMTTEHDLIEQETEISAVIEEIETQHFEILPADEACG